MPIDRLPRLLVITFIATAAEIFTGRGIYFFTEHRLHYTERQNLALALATYGSAAVVGLLSHKLAAWLGPKRTLVLATIGVVLGDAALLAHPAGPMLVIASAFKACCNLCKWPVIESYVSAGRRPRETAQAIGRFNLAWALPIPLTLPLVGAVVGGRWPAGIFALAIALELVELGLLRPLDSHPTHLPDDHADHLPAAEEPRYEALLVSGRYAMTAHAIVLMILAPLLPGVFKSLGWPVEIGTVAVSLIDLMRLAAFFAMYRWEGWHGRAGPLLAVTLAIPTSALMILLSNDAVLSLEAQGAAPGPALRSTLLALVIAGEVLYGLAAGVSYFAALYYAMVVKRASVEGGAVHEGLGAVGFTVGPAVGLGSAKFGSWLGAPAVGTLAGTGVLLGGLAWAGLSPLLRFRGTHATAPERTAAAERPAA